MAFVLLLKWLGRLRPTAILLALLLLLLSTTAVVASAADEEMPPVMTDEAAENESDEEVIEGDWGSILDIGGETPDTHPLGDYGRWLIHAQNMLLEMDMWGSTMTIPQGFAVGMFGYGTQRIYGRYDEHRKMSSIVDKLSIDDPFNIGGKFFTFDFGIDGSAHGYLAGLWYGVTDRLMVGVNTMWLVLHVKLDAEFIPGTSERLGVATREEFFRLLEKLGRPAPILEYDSNPADLGDTTLFVNWNYFRNSWFSAGVTTNLFLPTAHIAEPNKAIIFGLGPDLDAGNGAWGFGLVKMFDFRPPKPANIVTFSIGLEGAYFLQTKRKSPNFLKPDQDAWDYLEAQNVDLAFFPDLSDMDDYYYYTPPPWVAVSGGIGIGPLSVTYRHGWGFEGVYETNSPGFEQVIDEIGLVGTGDDGKLIFATAVPLTPLYIPGLMQFRFEYVTDGRNNLVFRDIYQIGMGVFIPINPPKRYQLPE